jgi:hypothetical protein
VAVFGGVRAPGDASRLFNVRRRPSFGGAPATFSPLSVPGLVAWWDPSDFASLFVDAAMTTPVAADGDLVGACRDKSGNGYHRLQSVGARRPTYRAGRIGGRAALQYFASGALTALVAASIPLPSQITLLAIVREASAANGYFIEHGPNAANVDGFYLFGGGDKPVFVRRSTTLNPATDSNWIGTSPVVIGISYDGVTLKYFKGGTLRGSQSGSLAESTVNLPLNFGARNQTSLAYNGDEGEVIVYGRSLSDDELARVTAYLRARWSV